MVNFVLSFRYKKNKYALANTLELLYFEIKGQKVRKVSLLSNSNSSKFIETFYIIAE